MRACLFSLFLLHVASQCDPCACDANGVVAGVDTGRPGCAAHIADNPPFCYVTAECLFPGALVSQLYPTLKYMACNTSLFVVVNDLCDTPATGAPTAAPCPADGQWPATAPGASVNIACPAGQTGAQTRMCEPPWGQITSVCSTAPSCTDGKQNGDEAGRDCGGSSCPACTFCQTVDCGPGNTCDAANSKCSCTRGYSGARCEVPPMSKCAGVNCGMYGDCNPDTGSCTCTLGFSGLSCETGPIPTCFDGLKNGNEKGIDCGGSPPCPACESVAWDYDDFGACSASCGGGVQVRAVRCVDAVKGVLPSLDQCNQALHPVASSMPCNIEDCPMYFWAPQSFEACSSTCGAATQQRDVPCYSSMGSVRVDDSKCPQPKPATTQACTNPTCTAAQRYVSLDWGVCDRDCGGGTQTRTVQCQLVAGGTVTTGCTGTQPGTSRACNVFPCFTYNWNACGWDECTSQCNGGTGMLGTQYREVYCRDEVGTAVDPSLCSEAKPKQLITGCNTDKCPGPNLMADGTGWKPCNPATRTQTRTFHCHLQNGANALLSSCADAPTRPAERSCVPAVCPAAAPTLSDGFALRPAWMVLLLVFGRSPLLGLVLGALGVQAGFLNAQSFHYRPVTNLRFTQVGANPGFSASGHPTPYAHKINIKASAFGKDFDVNASLMQNLLAPDHRVNGVMPPLTSYLVDNDDMAWGSVTVHSPDNIFLVIADREDVYTISNGSAVRESDLTDHDVEPIRNFQRRLLQLEPFDATCFTGFAAGKTLRMGIAADQGFSTRVTPTLAAGVNAVVATASAIYQAQMNVALQVGPTLFTTALPANLNNKQPCTATPSALLDTFRAWRATQGQNAGAWHLLTDCFPPPGTVGIAYIGVLCETSYGAGLSSFLDTRTWLTFAHEMGHNFGAQHTFVQGTAGIMDYGDGKYKGVYQFNKPMSQTEMCTEIKNGLTNNYAACFVGPLVAPTAATPTLAPVATPTPAPTQCPATERFGNCRMWSLMAACNDPLTTTFMYANCGKYCCGVNPANYDAPDFEYKNPKLMGLCLVSHCRSCTEDPSKCHICEEPEHLPSYNGHDCVVRSRKVLDTDSTAWPAEVRSTDCEDRTTCANVSRARAFGSFSVEEGEFIHLEARIKPLELDGVILSAISSGPKPLSVVWELKGGRLAFALGSTFVAYDLPLEPGKWVSVGAASYNGIMRVLVDGVERPGLFFADEDPAMPPLTSAKTFTLTLGSLNAQVDNLQIWATK